MRALIALLLTVVAAVIAILVPASSADVTGGASDARPAPPRLVETRTSAARLSKVGEFSEPVYLTAPDGSDDLYVVEQAGRIIRVSDGKRSEWADLTDVVTSGGEQGLLSLAFEPGWKPGGWAYVYYTDKAQDQRVAAFRASRRGIGELRTILRMPDSESNHNGGLLRFEGRHLFIGTGDGGGGGDEHGRIGNGQNRSTLLGKILRIEPTPMKRDPYRTAGNPGFGKPAIWAYGLRNPWRYDLHDGELIVADVGQSAWEEVTTVSRLGRGVNFGWRVWEGKHRYAEGSAKGHRKPQLEFSHDAGWCSITGGFVARRAPWKGQYLFGDFCKGDIRRTTPGSSSSRDTGLHVDALASFGLDGKGRMYAISRNGPVFRIAP